MSEFKVKVFGPNLRDQRHGSFHVHAADCDDCRHYGPGRRRGGDATAQDEPTLTVRSRREVVIWTYAPEEFDYDPDGDEYRDYRGDLKFEPCLKSLPEETPATKPRRNLASKSGELAGFIDLKGGGFRPATKAEKAAHAAASSKAKDSSTTTKNRRTNTGGATMARKTTVKTSSSKTTSKTALQPLPTLTAWEGTMAEYCQLQLKHDPSLAIPKADKAAIRKAREGGMRWERLAVFSDNTVDEVKAICDGVEVARKNGKPVATTKATATKSPAKPAAKAPARKPAAKTAAKPRAKRAARAEGNA